MNTERQPSPGILSVALQLISTSGSRQAQYMQKLRYYESLIQKSTDLKQDLLVSIRSEELKQRYFSTVDNLIKENNQCQRLITRLQEELVEKRKAEEIGEVRKGRRRERRQEEEMRRVKEENERVKEVEEMVGKVKEEIQKIVKENNNVGFKREESDGEDPCKVLSRERQHILMMKRIIEGRREEFQLSWRVTKEMNESLNKREDIQSANVLLMQKILETESKTNTVYYKNDVRDLNEQERELIENYQKEILSLKDRNDQQKQKIEELERKGEEDKIRVLETIEKFQRIKLEMNDQKILGQRMQAKIKEDTISIERLQRQKQALMKSSRKQEGTISDHLSQENAQLKQQIRILREKNDSLISSTPSFETVKLSMAGQISDLRERLIEEEKLNQMSQKNLQKISRQNKNQLQMLDNLRQKIVGLNQVQKSLEERVAEGEKEKNRMVEERGRVKKEQEKLLREIQDLKRGQKEQLNKREEIAQKNLITAKSIDGDLDDKTMQQSLNDLNEIIYHMTFRNDSSR